jgi:CO dehydrogenase/acetyl-CoA synthase beta subunit
MEDVKQMYANIKLPVNVYPNGEFKMLYDQMQIEIEMSNLSELTNFINENATEIGKEIEERMYEKEEEDEEEEDKDQEKDQDNETIYKSDYPLKKHKRRWNTTFKKNIQKNKLTKKNYLPIDDIDYEST